MIKGSGVRGQGSERRGPRVNPLYPLPFALCLLFTVYYLMPSVSCATDLPLRGIARGESKIKVGDKAPLVTQALQKAHREGKVIALMLGYSPHCPWCDRMERYIDVMMKETNNFGNRAVFIQVQTEHAKLIPPPPEGPLLKEAFGVEGQPWLFIIDKNGVVRRVYKIFVPMGTFKKDIEELVGEK